MQHRRHHHHHLLRATKKGPQKTEDTNKSSSKSNNFIKYQSKPYTDKDGDNPRPWYIDEASVKRTSRRYCRLFSLASVHRNGVATVGGVYQSAVGTHRRWEFVFRQHILMY